jgi:hypothetical protein
VPEGTAVLAPANADFPVAGPFDVPEEEVHRLPTASQKRIALFWYVTTFECFLHRFFSWRRFGPWKTAEFDPANSGNFFFWQIDRQLFTMSSWMKKSFPNKRASMR